MVGGNVGLGSVGIVLTGGFVGAGQLAIQLGFVQYAGPAPQNPVLDLHCSMFRHGSP
jgi:hypothetical protein